MIRAHEVHEHMREVGQWVNWEEPTSDGFVCGEPTRLVGRLAVMWAATTDALKMAAEDGCDMVITHEPVFYASSMEQALGFRRFDVEKKKKLVDELGLIIYRCHDVWDRYPEIGVLDSWCKGLGFLKPRKKHMFYALFDVESITVEGLASRIAQYMIKLGGRDIRIVGDAKKRIGSVALGTGAITYAPHMRDLGAECAIVTDDGFTFWQQGIWAMDAGFPLLVAEHAVAEAWGIQNLAMYLQSVFKAVDVKYYPQKSFYEGMGAQEV